MATGRMAGSVIKLFGTEGRFAGDSAKFTVRAVITTLAGRYTIKIVAPPQAIATIR